MSKQCNDLAERGKFQLSYLRSQHLWSSRSLADYSMVEMGLGCSLWTLGQQIEMAPAGCSDEANVVSQDSESDLIITGE